MIKEKYLYGASVQGIQSFIFQTNELKDIVGASELVEQICTDKFAKSIGKDSADALKADPNAIMMAAGSIKYVFDSSEKEKLEYLVLNFPRTIIESAPGIIISQAVVRYSSDNDNEQTEDKAFESAINLLEMRLREQRNTPLRSSTIGMTGIMRSPKSGLPAVEFDEGEAIDLGTKQKRASSRKGNKNSTKKLCEKSFGIPNLSHDRIAYDISDITDKNDWIAIIHADGNGLGQIVQKVGHLQQTFKEFSFLLNEATVAAANKAYNAVADWPEDAFIPLRPIVLGGDDMTIICRADIAIKYTETFISEFEKETQKKLGSILKENKVFDDGADKLTACAGIAFIKSSYPFYYGYYLAEELCTQAKKEAKSINPLLAPSCLMFHKVQSSYVEDFSTITKRELNIPEEKESTTQRISFKFGPYYIHKPQVCNKEKYWDSHWDVKMLNDTVDLFDSESYSPIKNHLREWISLLINNPGLADQKLKRLIRLWDSRIRENESNSINKEILDFIKKVTTPNACGTIPVYDLLALHSVKSQITK